MTHGVSIESQFHKTLSSIGQPGSPSLLPEEAQSWMIEFVRRRCAEHNPVTYAELLDDLDYHHRIMLSRNSFRHIVPSMMTLKSVVETVKDSERLGVDASEIDAWYNIISEELIGVSRRFVFSVDETDCSEHIDSHEVTIVDPINFPDPLVLVPVNRDAERSALTACIAADRYRIKPFVIVDRATVEAEVGLYRYRREAVICEPSSRLDRLERLYTFSGLVGRLDGFSIFERACPLPQEHE
jgi:hypothetical protein